MALASCLLFFSLWLLSWPLISPGAWTPFANPAAGKTQVSRLTHHIRCNAARCQPNFAQRRKKPTLPFPSNHFRQPVPSFPRAKVPILPPHTRSCSSHSPRQARGILKTRVGLIALDRKRAKPCAQRGTTDAALAPPNRLEAREKRAKGRDGRVKVAVSGRWVQSSLFVRTGICNGSILWAAFRVLARSCAGAASHSVSQSRPSPSWPGLVDRPSSLVQMPASCLNGASKLQKRLTVRFAACPILTMVAKTSHVPRNGEGIEGEAQRRYSCHRRPRSRSSRSISVQEESGRHILAPFVRMGMKHSQRGGFSIDARGRDAGASRICLYLRQLCSSSPLCPPSSGSGRSHGLASPRTDPGIGPPRSWGNDDPTGIFSPFASTRRGILKPRSLQLVPCFVEKNGGRTTDNCILLVRGENTNKKTPPPPRTTRSSRP